MSGVPPGLDLTDPETTVGLLALLSALFLLRVVGHILVVLRAPAWLPPMDQWYSGVLPYPHLLATQVVLLAAMAAVMLAMLRGTSWALGPHPAAGSVLLVVAYGYAGSMAPRYVIRMARRPDERWLGGCIPIVFHVVLATWLFVLGSHWRPGG